jgi:hypothetical protein
VTPRVAATLLTLLGAASASACAAIWGFQDATDLRDASVDGSADGTADGTIDTNEDRGADQGTGEVASGDGALDASPEATATCAQACVAAPPDNTWVGPFAIEEGTMLAGCTGPYPAQQYRGYAEASAPAASCTCACGAPEGGTCSDPVTNFWFDNVCTKGCGSPNQAIQTSCTPVTGSGCSHFTLSAPVASGGSCAPSGTTEVPDAAWTVNAILCGSDAGTGGCDDGSVCTPTTTGPFLLATYCIATNGDTATCPSSYPKVRTYFASASDTRGCSTCSCGSPDGSACVGGTTTFYDQPGCSHNPVSEPMPSGCTNNPNGQSGIYTGETPAGGSCSPSGGLPVGTFTPTSPTTICCTK